MGIDLYGRNATGKPGEYLRANGDGWEPLVEYIGARHRRFIGKIVPPIDPETGTVEPTPWMPFGRTAYWYTNNGWGLPATAATALADRFEADLRSGAAERWIDAFTRRIQALPRENCWLCHGTGIRADEIGIEAGYPTRIVTEPPENPRLGQTGSCNACQGWGTSEPIIANYRITTEDVAEFAQFFRHSGGFEIW
jgi:hypothetical protein